ncbi:MAG: holo-ACP synthase [Chloroflexi bacterium]|nr:holo-ACP synthase [Chloroflexota bacterium]
MHHVGVDIIEIARVAEAIARWGDRFLQRIYTDAELEAYGKDTFSLAARFAAKEAVMKALGTPFTGVRWREIEVLADASGKPTVRLYGRAQAQAARLGLSGLAISLSHSKSHAIAFVLGETK